MDRASIPLGSSCTAKGKEGGRCAWDSHPFPPGSLLPHCNMKGGKRGTSNLLGPQCTAEKRCVCVCGGGNGIPFPSGPPCAAGGKGGSASPFLRDPHTARRTGGRVRPSPPGPQRTVRGSGESTWDSHPLPLGP